MCYQTLLKPFFISKETMFSLSKSILVQLEIKSLLSLLLQDKGRRKWNANSHLELNPGTWFELPVYWPLLYVWPPGNHQPSQSSLYTPQMVLHNPIIHLAAIQYVPVGTSSETNHKNVWEGLWTRSRLGSSDQCAVCMTFGFIPYRIGGKQSSKCQISCTRDK